MVSVFDDWWTYALQTRAFATEIHTLRRRLMRSIQYDIFRKQIRQLLPIGKKRYRNVRQEQIMLRQQILRILKGML